MAGHLFDDWFDPIEAAVREWVRAGRRGHERGRTLWISALLDLLDDHAVGRID